MTNSGCALTPWVCGLYISTFSCRHLDSNSYGFFRTSFWVSHWLGMFGRELNLLPLFVFMSACVYGRGPYTSRTIIRYNTKIGIKKGRRNGAKERCSISTTFSTAYVITDGSISRQRIANLFRILWVQDLRHWHSAWVYRSHILYSSFEVCHSHFRS